MGERDYDDLSHWTPRARPARVVLQGRYCSVEPLDPNRHGDSLFEASMAPDAERRHKYLFDNPMDRAAYEGWLAQKAGSEDPLFFAVVDKATGKAEGRQTLMRITPEQGVIEIGNILWGPRMSRTRLATEALYLHAKYIFEDLGYRRFEWKCHNDNEPSKRAALRFGFQFEGIFRKHMVARGANRDTAWFGMVDSDWPQLKAAYERWLEPGNFDAGGGQKVKLEQVRGAG